MINFELTALLMTFIADITQDYSELGAVLNGFSLNETGELASAIEKTGQAVDATYMSTAKLVGYFILSIFSLCLVQVLQLSELEQNWAEPLNEYAQFASIIKKLLTYRHQKHVQYEMTQDALELRRESLEDLERSEREARRLEAALGRGRVNGIGPARTVSQTSEASGEGRGETEGEAPENEEQTLESPASYLPPHPGPNPARRRTKAPGMGLLSALSYTLHGMMDVDPEAARRNGISKTKETISHVCFLTRSSLLFLLTLRPISQLEDALHLSAQDLKYSSSTIQADLDRFQRQKVADLREMTISMARSHRDWCKKVQRYKFSFRL
jgi:hypothetical protein